MSFSAPPICPTNVPMETAEVIKLSVPLGLLVHPIDLSNVQIKAVRNLKNIAIK